MDLDIERLTVEDVPEAVELSTQVGWNQTEADWRRLLELFPETCFCGRVGGDLVATSSLATYGGRVGWIGMVLVDEDHRRRGYGSAIFERALEAGIERDLEAIGLDATDAGSAVYEQYDFETVLGIDRWIGQPTVPATVGGTADVREARAVDVAAEYDASRLGIDRRQLLENLGIASGSTCLVREVNGLVVGYGIVRPGRSNPQLGPLVADEREDAEAILAAVANRLDGPVFVDAIRRPETAEILDAFGFEVQRRLHRMTLDGAGPSLAADAALAAAGFEWG